MKRSTLRRASRLPRTGYLRRTGRLRAVSERRAETLGDRAEVCRLVMDRDHGRCQFPIRNGLRYEPGCFGPVHPHHLLKASQGGRYEVANLTLLCDFHNGWVEDNPHAARELGLVRYSWEAS